MDASGRYTTPLLYLNDGPDIVVVASQGGRPKNPQWYHNLRAHLQTRIHLKGHRDLLVRAHEAAAAERAVLWPRHD